MARQPISAPGQKSFGSFLQKRTLPARLSGTTRVDLNACWYYLDGGTLITGGTITGGAAGSGGYRNGLAGDAVLFGTVASTLIIDSGAVFNGLVAGNEAASDVLSLAGTSLGTFDGLGTQFLDFATVTESGGANWILAGTNIVATGTRLLDAGFLDATGALTNDGTIDALGALTSGQTVAGNATIWVGMDGSLSLLAGAASGQAGFGAHDMIGLQAPGGLAETGYNFAAGTLTIVDGATTIASLHFDGQYTSGSFALTSDGHNALLLTFASS